MAVKFGTAAHALDDHPIYREGAKLFRRLDSNHSGTLDRDELRAGAANEPTLLTLLGAEDELAMRLLDADRDQSGEITWSEFEALLLESARARAP